MENSISAQINSSLHSLIWATCFNYCAFNMLWDPMPLDSFHHYTIKHYIIEGTDYITDDKYDFEYHFKDIKLPQVSLTSYPKNITIEIFNNIPQVFFFLRWNHFSKAISEIDYHGLLRLVLLRNLETQIRVSHALALKFPIMKKHANLLSFTAGNNIYDLNYAVMYELYENKENMYRDMLIANIQNATKVFLDIAMTHYGVEDGGIDVYITFKQTSPTHSAIFFSSGLEGTPKDQMVTEELLSFPTEDLFTKKDDIINGVHDSWERQYPVFYNLANS